MPPAPGRDPGAVAASLARRGVRVSIDAALYGRSAPAHVPFVRFCLGSDERVGEAVASLCDEVLPAPPTGRRHERRGCVRRASRTVGAGHLFGVSGANIELLFDAAARHDAVQPVLAKHEAAAAMMAIGYAERADRLGVVLTTSGGGAFNISAPLTEALESGVPILALVGQSPVGRNGTGAFQDSSGCATRVDAERIFAPLSVHCVRVGAAEDALGAAQRGAAPPLRSRARRSSCYPGTCKRPSSESRGSPRCRARKAQRRCRLLRAWSRPWPAPSEVRSRR